jgi:hypothetical protein
MSKYIIEGNINFNQELYKLLDEDSDNEDELCQITGLKLEDKYVTLECKHKFNYKALYTEICKQKFEFKTYFPHLLTKRDEKKFNDSKLDYFIKCPYCRNIQFTVLPYYEELGLKEIYGINSLDKKLIITNENEITQHTPNLKVTTYTFKRYGVTFQFGDCCEKINVFGDTCNSHYASTIPNTLLSYCPHHYKEGLKKHKQKEKKNAEEKKMIVKQEKENKLNEKKKLLEEKNIERETKGLPPLKRLPTLKKVENVVEQQNNFIQPYVPEGDNSNVNNIVCNAILKSGPNKGKICGSKKITENGLCNRHSSK